MSLRGQYVKVLGRRERSPWDWGFRLSLEFACQVLESLGSLHVFLAQIRAIGFFVQLCALLVCSTGRQFVYRYTEILDRFIVFARLFIKLGSFSIGHFIVRIGGYQSTD